MAMAMAFKALAKGLNPESFEMKLDEMNKGVDTHLVAIAEKLVDLDGLTTRLGLRYQVYTDIVAEFPRNIPSQRSALLREWKRIKGRGATYRALLTALCEARETDSAEDLVKCLKGWNIQDVDSTRANSAATTITENACPLDSSANLIQSSITPEVYEDLEHILKMNRKQIINQYAEFISHLCDYVVDKGISVDRLRNFVLRLPAFTSDDCEERPKVLSGVEEKIEAADNIYKIFNIIGKECASFLNCDIFLSILKRFCSDIDSPEFKYPEQLEAYINKHRVEEFFDVNPQLEKITEGSEKLKLKIDIKATSKAAKVVSLKSSLCGILGLTPSSLRIFSIEEGCIIVTFLIPALVSATIFYKEMQLTSKQKKDLEALSVLWIKCGEYECSICDTIYSKDTETTDLTEEISVQEKFPYTLMECALPLLTCKEYTRSSSKDHFTCDSGVGTTFSKDHSQLTSNHSKKHLATDSGIGTFSSEITSKGHTDFANEVIKRHLADVGTDIGLAKHRKSFGGGIVMAVEQLCNLLDDEHQSSGEELKDLLGQFQLVGLRPEELINYPIQHHKGRTAIHLAAHQDNIECLDILLKSGGNPNVKSFIKDRNRTPLHVAASKGHYRSIKTLLDHGAFMNVSNTLGETAYSLARNKVANEKEFRHAFSRYIVPRRTNELQKTVETLHKIGGECEFYEDIYWYGGAEGGFSYYYDQLPPKCTDLSTRWTDYNNQTLLYRVTSNNHLDFVQYMLKVSASQPLHNLETNETPLLKACQNGFDDIAMALLEHSPKLSFVSESDNMLTPLSVACSRGYIKIVSLILQAIKKCIHSFDSNDGNVISLNFQDSLGHTTLYKACHYGYTDIAKLLIQFQLENKSKISVSINAATTETQRTPLHEAVARGDLELVKLLLSVKNINVNAEGRPSASTNKKLFRIIPHGKSLQHDSVAILEHQTTGKLVCQASFYQSDEYKLVYMTPLAEACVYKHKKIMKILLQKGAQDCKGLACRIAHQMQRSDLIELILSYHAQKSLEEKGDGICMQWSNLKLTQCSGSWIGQNAEFSLLYHEGVDSLSSDEICNPVSANPELKLQCNAVHAVHLEQNQLSSLPIELFQLPNVHKINVSGNCITCLPADMSSRCGWQCMLLRELDISSNSLNDIPACVWSLPNLIALDCARNAICALPFDSNSLSTSLKHVDLSKNCLRSLPRYLFELRSLQYLNLNENKITELPEALWTCYSLQELHIASNQLSSLPQCEPDSQIMHGESTFKDSYGRHLPIQQVDTVFVGMENKAPRIYWKRKKSLYHQTVPSINPVGASQKVFTADQCALKKLDISRNEFLSFPEALPCFVPFLTDLDISSNPITDVHIQTIPPFLKALTAKGCRISRVGIVASKLHQIYLHQNCHGQCIGFACPHRSHMQLLYLETLDLRGNKLQHLQLTCQEPIERRVDFGKFEKEYKAKAPLLYPALEVLDVSFNNLIGTFNPNIGQQTRLKKLVLSNNIVLKKIPMELAYLKKLRNLVELEMNDLPQLNDPPSEYRIAGLQHLLTYMKSRLKESSYYRSIKLFFIGNSKRGKTTLLRRLKYMAEDMDVERTAGIDIETWTYPNPKKFAKKDSRKPVKFIALDFAGQDVYHTTHQCFYSKRSMYLVLFRLIDGEEGIEELEEWLRSVQLRAPGCPVIIIGTHLDAVPDKTAKELKKKTLGRYSRPNYPKIVSMVSISNLKKLFSNKMEQLRKHLYEVACHLAMGKDGISLQYKPDMAESDPKALFQQLIPQSFLTLQDKISEKVVKLKSDGKSPIMESTDFQCAFKCLFDDEDELKEAVYFLNLQGTLLHFEDHNLRNVYFLDFQWLAKLMAEVIHPVAMGTATHINKGVAEISGIFKHMAVSSVMKCCYISLLEKFEVAVKVNDQHLLIPSLMPDKISYPVVSIQKKLESPPLRRFWMADFVPAGFWPRLICRVATDQQISHVLSSICAPVHTSVDDSFDDSQSPRSEQNLRWAPWKTGMAFSYQGQVLMEMKQEPNRSNVEFLEKWRNLSPLKSNYRIELHIYTDVWVSLSSQESQNFSQRSVLGLVTKLMVMVAGHVKSLTSWFPGMLQSHTPSRPFVTYMACWKCYAEIEPSKSLATADAEKEDFICKGKTPVRVYVLSDHIVTAVSGKPLECSLHGDLKMSHVAPDLIFCDLTDVSHLDCNAPLHICDDEVLGRGGSGFVCKGEMQVTQAASENPGVMNVAVKVFLKDIKQLFGSTTIHQLLELSKDPVNLHYAYNQIRQEVSFLSNLRHQNLTKLCGVRTSPYMCLVLELAPKRSLRIVLRKYKECGVQLEPVTSKIAALQIARGLDYLHSNQVVHLDMKSSNVLILRFPSPRDSRQVRVKNSEKVWIKIADYGISRISTGMSLKVQPAPVGTPGYMAPELFTHVGSIVSAEKVDVFAYGMVLYELLTKCSPSETSAALQDGHPPFLSAHTLIKLQEIMELCWDKEPENRPKMDQVVSWMQMQELERLRTSITLGEIKSFSCACVCHIQPENEPEVSQFQDWPRTPKGSCSSDGSKDSSTREEEAVTDLMSPSAMVVEEPIFVKSVDGNLIGIDDEAFQFLPSKSRKASTIQRNSKREIARQNTNEQILERYTQIWTSGGDKKQGQLQIVTYHSGDRDGHHLFNGYYSSDEVTCMCAVKNMMWMGTSAGSVKIFHAPTLKAKFIHTLDRGTKTITDILYVEEMRAVFVSSLSGEVWSFFDTITRSGLKLHYKIEMAIEACCYRLVKVSLRGGSKFEVWGTVNDNKLLVIEQSQNSWQNNDVAVQPTDPKLHHCHLLASISFKNSFQMETEHVWLTYYQNSMLVSFDARTRKQRAILNCKDILKNELNQPFHISALMCVECRVLVGTSVGSVAIFHSETSTLLNYFHWHRGEVYKLLALPRLVYPCICPEVPFDEDRSSGDEELESPMIASIGCGKVELHTERLNEDSKTPSGHQCKDSDVVLLAWKI